MLSEIGGLFGIVSPLMAYILRPFIEMSANLEIILSLFSIKTKPKESNKNKNKKNKSK